MVLLLLNSLYGKNTFKVYLFTDKLHPEWMLSKRTSVKPLPSSDIADLDSCYIFGLKQLAQKVVVSKTLMR